MKENTTNPKESDRVKIFYTWVKSNKITSSLIIFSIIIISLSKVVSSLEIFEKTVNEKIEAHENETEFKLNLQYIENDIKEIIQFYKNYNLDSINVKLDFDVLNKIENLEKKLFDTQSELSGRTFIEEKCKDKFIEIKYLVFPLTYKLYKKYKENLGKKHENNYKKKLKVNCQIATILCDFLTSPCSNDDINLIAKTLKNIPK